jgi:hypothetical protein
MYVVGDIYMCVCVCVCVKSYSHIFNTDISSFDVASLSRRTCMYLRVDIVTCIPIARQRLGKHIPAEANARYNRTSIGRQRISKHACLTVEAVFYAWSVQSGYKEGFT